MKSGKIIANSKIVSELVLKMKISKQKSLYLSWSVVANSLLANKSNFIMEKSVPHVKPPNQSLAFVLWFHKKFNNQKV